MRRIHNAAAAKILARQIKDIAERPFVSSANLLVRFKKSGDWIDLTAA